MEKRRCKMTPTLQRSMIKVISLEGQNKCLMRSEWWHKQQGGYQETPTLYRSMRKAISWRTPLTASRWWKRLMCGISRASRPPVCRALLTDGMLRKWYNFLSKWPSSWIHSTHKYQQNLQATMCIILIMTACTINRVETAYRQHVILKFNTAVNRCYIAWLIRLRRNFAPFCRWAEGFPLLIDH